MASVTRLLETTRPTASSAIRALVDLAILSERTGRARGQAFGYDGYLEILRTD